MVSLIFWSLHKLGSVKLTRWLSKKKKYCNQARFLASAIQINPFSEEKKWINVKKKLINVQCGGKWLPAKFAPQILLFDSSMRKKHFFSEQKHEKQCLIVVVGNGKKNNHFHNTSTHFIDTIVAVQVNCTSEQKKWAVMSWWLRHRKKVIHRQS